MGTSPGRSRAAWTRYVRNGAQTELPILMEVLDDIPVMGIDWDADRAVTELYNTHYRSLVRLAALLIRDVATAEEVVQDSFVAMHSGWRRLCDSDKALSYLRQSVVNRSRSVLRHRVVADRNAARASGGCAQRRARRHRPAGALSRRGRPARPASPSARGTGAALLRRYERGADRFGHGH